MTDAFEARNNVLRELGCFPDEQEADTLTVSVQSGRQEQVAYTPSEWPGIHCTLVDFPEGTHAVFVTRAGEVNIEQKVSEQEMIRIQLREKADLVLQGEKDAVFLFDGFVMQGSVVERNTRSDFVDELRFVMKSRQIMRQQRVLHGALYQVETQSFESDEWPSVHYVIEDYTDEKRMVRRRASLLRIPESK